MTKFTIDQTLALISWRHFIGMMLIVVLMIPAAIVSQSSPAPVNLGTTGNFVILAKTGISTTGTTSIVGDIGVSPIDHTAITGFGFNIRSLGYIFDIIFSCRESICSRLCSSNSDYDDYGCERHGNSLHRRSGTNIA